MATSDPATTIPSSEEIPAVLTRDEEGHRPAAGTSPWKLAWRRLRRNRVAILFLVILILVFASALLAPVWAEEVAKTGPNDNHLSDTITVDGEQKNVVDFDGVPIGPQYFGADGRYFLGADGNGRDVMVRLLYGARNSLFIGLTAALITVILAVTLGLLAGYFRGGTDFVISRGLDILWAFPVLLLGIALGVALAIGGLNIGPISIAGNSKWIPTLIIGVVSIVYLARPLRGQVMSLREKEFVEAARAQGASHRRIMFGELLPNLASTILVFLPVLVANAILLEAALSFLGAGVRAPESSWGTMISEGLKLLITAPHLTVVPGAMLALTVLSVNVIGDAVRDALDPRAKIRIER